MTIQRPLIQIYNTETAQVIVREMDDAEYSAWLSEQDILQAASVRAERNRLLTETDWLVIKTLEAGNGPDFNLAVYRQALRDVPTQPGFPQSVNWPSIDELSE